MKADIFKDSSRDGILSLAIRAENKAEKIVLDLYQSRKEKSKKTIRGALDSALKSDDIDFIKEIIKMILGCEEKPIYSSDEVLMMDDLDVFPKKISFDQVQRFWKKASPEILDD